MKFKSRRFSKTVANDFGTVSSKRIYLITHSFSLNGGVLTTLCLNPTSVCASCANERKKCIQDVFLLIIRFGALIVDS